MKEGQSFPRTSRKNCCTCTSKTKLSTSETKHFQDLHARTFDSNSLGSHKFMPGPPTQFHQDLYKAFSQGPVQDHARTSDIGLGSAHTDLYKIMPGPVTKFHHDLYKTFSQLPSQDHARATDIDLVSAHTDLYKIMPGPLTSLNQDLYKTFAQGPVQDHAMTSNSIDLGSPQDLRTRTCTRSCNDLLEDSTRISTRSCHKVL